MFAAWGRFVYRFRWVVLAVSVLSIAAVIFSMQYGGRLGTGEFSAPEGTEMAHPWRTLVPAVALLLLLGSPFMNTRIGLSGADTLSHDAESRRGEELLDNQFPDTSAFPMVVVLDYQQGSPLTREHVGETYDLSRWLEDRPGVKEVSGIVNLDPKLSRNQYRELLSGPRKDLPPQCGER